MYVAGKEALNNKYRGTLEVGKTADLLVVKGDPLANIRNLRNIQTVVKAGRIMETGYHPWFQNPIPRATHETGGINPVPVITSLSQIIATEGDKELVLKVTGRQFVPGCRVTFDGRSVLIISGSPTELTVKLGSEDLQRVGAFPVVVTNPWPEGGPSEPVYFWVKFR